MEIKKYKPSVMAVISVLLLLVLLSSCFVSGLYAKYVTSATPLLEMTVAAFRVSDNYKDDWNSEVSLSGAFAPGETRDYEFSINYAECQTDVSTSITLKSNRVLPLSFSLYGCTASEIGSSSPISWDVTEDDFYTATYSFVRQETDSVKDFTLRIKWQSGSDDEFFRGLTDNIVLTVISEQIEPS